MNNVAPIAKNEIMASPEPASIMEVISRAAADPNTDVSKLERLLGMYERVTAQQAKAAYTAALVATKPQLPVIERHGKIKIGTSLQPYALWEDIDAAITPILAANGFALTFRSGVTQDGKITVTGVLSHAGGHSEETTITLPHDSSGSKNAVQAVGSSTSYGKRYTATMLLNIRTKGEDDDGHKGGASATIDEDQAEKVFDLIKRTKTDTGKFCKYFGISSVPDLKASDYERAIVSLNVKAKEIA